MQITGARWAGFLCLLLLCCLTMAPARAQNNKQGREESEKYVAPDSTSTPLELEELMTEPEFIAAMLLDTSVYIGVFRSPGLDEDLHSLKSGILPEVEEGYMDVAMRYGLCKLNVLQGIRGSFDSLVFTQLPAFETDREEPLQFMPFPESQWLLFLQSSYNPQGQPRAEWVIHMDKPKVQNYINPSTAYDVADPYHACFCTKWNNAYEKPPGLPMAGQELINDLKIIVQTIKGLPADNTSPAYNKALDKMQDQLKDPTGKILGKEVRKRLDKKK